MSVASESSFNSARQSTNDGLRPNTVGTGDDDNVFDEPHSAQLGIFGVLYTVSKEKQLTSVKFAFFRLFLDFLQLWLLVVNPHYGWSIDGDSMIWEVVSFIQLNSFMTARGYTFFLALLYVFVGLLVVNLALSVWVAHSFSNNRFDHVWPIQFLRWFGLIFYQILDIATLTLLLVTLDCNYLASDKQVKFHNQEFPNVECWSMPHIVHVAVSVVSIILFIIAAACMVLSEMELNPLTRNYMAIAHTRDEGLGFAIKSIVTIASVMLSSSLKVMALVYLFFFILLLYIYVRWVPFIYSTLNYVRCGSYATVLYSSVLLVFLAFGPQKEDYRKQVTLALWIGMAPAALLGAFLCHMRLHHFARVLDRFRYAETGTNSKHIYRFTDVREVQIMARCCRHWIDEDTLEPEAVALSEQVIKAGMMQLPHDPQMVIIYSSFLIDVQGSYQSGYTQLQTAKKQSPGVLERFAIFSREQEHTQKASGAHSGDSSVDLVSYVEFQRNHRLVLRAHREALLAIRAFWGLLLKTHVNFNHLSKALNRIEVTVKTAERAYRSVLIRHQGSARIVRLYGKFLESVKFDPWAASKWYTEADRLDEVAEHSKEALQLGGIEMLMPQQGSGGGRGLAAMEGVAFICINAQGTVQVASNEAHSLLGYAKNELKGKDVGIIMPPPFAERHPAYVRNYIQTGTSAMLDRNLEVVVVTKTRHIVPVKLKVTKLSGLNEDSVFLGVLEPLPDVPGDARMWVLGNGVIIAADSVFCDWLGFEPTDLVGKAVEEFLVEKEAVREAIKVWNKAQPASGSRVQTNRPRRISLSMGDAISAAIGLPSPADKSVKPDKSAKPDKSIPGNVYGDKAGVGWLRRASYVDPTRANGGEAAAGFPPPPPPMMLQRAEWRHKFCQPLEFDTYLQPGAIGNIKVHAVIIRRCSMRAVATFQRSLPDPNLHDMMLVTDHKGKVLHATAALATALGRTPDAIRAGGLGILMPEPTSVLHGPWLMELSNPQPLSIVSPDNPPPLSCRSGVAVSLATYDPLQGPGLKQFRLSVKHQLMDGGAGKVHVVALQPLPLRQALSERRLSLTLDLKGTILSADESTPAQLFGADPRDLPGTSIATLVDLFQLDEQDRILMGVDELGMTGSGLRPAKTWSDNLGISGASAGEYGGGGSGLASSPHGKDELEKDVLEFAAGAAQEAFSRRLAKALLKLAQRSSDSPGCSWRVGVNQPPDEQARVELEQMAAVLGPEGLSAAARLVGSKRVPAVMTVRLVRRQPQPLKEPEPPSPRSGVFSIGDASSHGRNHHRAFMRHESGLTFYGATGKKRAPGASHVKRFSSAEFINANSTANSSPVPPVRLYDRAPDSSLVAEMQARFVPTADQPYDLPYGDSNSGAATEDSRGAQFEASYLGASRPGMRAPTVSKAPVAEGTEIPPSVTSDDGISPVKWLHRHADWGSARRMGGGPVAEATETVGTTPVSRAVPGSVLDLPVTNEEEALLEQLVSSIPDAPEPPTAPRGKAASSASSSPAPSSTVHANTTPTASPVVQRGASLLSAAVAATVERSSSDPIPTAGTSVARASRTNAAPRPSGAGALSARSSERMPVKSSESSALLQWDAADLRRPATTLEPHTSAGLKGPEAPPLTASGTRSRQSQGASHPTSVTFPAPLADVASPVWPIVGSSKTLRLPPGSEAAKAAVPTASTEGFQAPCLVLEVELWRADLLSGVLEVDERGRVLQTDVHCPLGQSGLVLGTPPSGIPGRQVSELLPLPPGGVAALLQPTHVGGDTVVRGALKKRGVRQSRMGSPTLMTIRHQGDGCALSLQVQAVRRSGPAGCALLCIRPAVPTTAQPGFARWLLDGDASGLMSALSTSGPTPVRATTYVSMSSGGLDLPGAPHSPQLSPPPLPPQISALSMPIDYSVSPMRATSQRGSFPAMTRTPSRLSFTTAPSPGAAGGADALQDVAASGEASGGVSAKARQDGVPEAPALRPSLDTAYYPPRNRALNPSRSPAHSGSGDLTVRNGAVAEVPSPRTTAALDSASEVPNRKGTLSEGKQSMIQSWMLGGEVKGDSSLRAGNEMALLTGGPVPKRERVDVRTSDTGSGSDGEVPSLDGGDGDARSSAESSSCGEGQLADGPLAKQDVQAAGQDVESEAGAHVANYSVGKRFKKLFKILMSPLALKPARRLRWHTVAAMALLVTAQTVVFVLLLVKLLQQQAAVNDLDSVSEAARKVHEIGINTLVLNSLYSANSYVEGLPQFGEPLEEAIASVYDDLTSVAHELKDLHHGVYLGFRQLRRINNAFGLRDIWDKPKMNISVYYDQNDPNRPATLMPGSDDPLLVPMGLWEAGNFYYAKTLDIINNGQRNVVEGVNFTAWASYRFIQTNGVPVIFSSYLQTLDALVSITVKESNDIYRLQLIVLILEGGLMCILVCMYMWFAARRYSRKRHALYSIFIKIPVGITRGLANMSLVLEADDEEDDDNDLNQQDLTDEVGGIFAGDNDGGVLTDNAVKAASSDKRAVRTENIGSHRPLPAALSGNKRRGSAMFPNMGIKGLEEEPEGGGAAVSGNGNGIGGRTPSARFAVANAFVVHLLSWRNRARVAPQPSSGGQQKHKRRLLDSNRLAVAMVMPFLLWGAATIAVNLVGYYSMEKLAAPIATLNVVNVVVIRFHRVLYYALAVVTAASYTACDFFKSFLSVELQDWRLEYRAMLYGNEVIPGNSSSAHFQLADTGVLFGGYTSPVGLLYYTTDCLAEDPVACQPPDSPYYQVTHNGLDVLLQSQFNAMESLLKQPIQSSNLNSTEFGLIWATGQTDLEGGLSAMSTTFLNEVQGSYRRVVIQQIVMVCVTWVWVLLFMLIQLRPLVRKAQNEMRRIAELLSQLPGEVDCEALVTNVIIGERASIMPVGVGKNSTASKSGLAADAGGWAALRRRASAGGLSAPLAKASGVAAMKNAEYCV